jgi:hypothetical protein
VYLSLNPTVVAGRVPWPDFARLAAKVGYPGVDVDLAAAMKAGLPATNFVGRIEDQAGRGESARGISQRRRRLP